VATLDAGDAFGMGALIDHRPRTASCVCRGDVIALTLARDAWHNVVVQPKAGRALRVAMVRALAEQLAYANGQLALLDLTAGSHDLTPLLMASVGVEAPASRLGGGE
ncbi:MAG: CRP-like cAMP-binding protein, partial [Kiritimatiellia bacterium]